ncbi:hypothetical protein ITJ44_15525 [Clavibacter sp. VKM Ac-2873]|uniref:hypothetical protein n=1 Tax=Clavibacter sp. VKM Ac-2873 TaxID=2783813 RepID=UPI00188A0275|nr:hypothetical protein [Clavibacter sp. VKM Ac-2873]MBF4619487.1 hypothetical protein [Clavibacter sp. VKM Ac-2873]
MVGIIGSLTTGIPAAYADETSIAAAVQDGSFLEDVVDGRISVEQLVAASAAGNPQRAQAIDRAALTRGMTLEVEELRNTGDVAAWGDPGDQEDGGELMILRPATTTTSAAGSMVEAQLSLSRDLKRLFHHWGTAKISAPTGGALLGGGTAAGIAAVVAGAFWLLASAIFVSIGAVAFVTLGSIAVSCHGKHLPYLYIKFPDLGNSHCGQ